MNNARKQVFFYGMKSAQSLKIVVQNQIEKATEYQTLFTVINVCRTLSFERSMQW